MDVSSSATTNATAATVGFTSPAATTPGANATAPSQAVQPTTPGAPTQAAAPTLGSPSSTSTSSPKSAHQGGIAPAIAKLFGTGGGAPTPIPLNVSYRVDGDFIVTIFSDPKTGQEVAQLPPEILIGLAQFFDHQDGVTLDQNA